MYTFPARTQRSSTQEYSAPSVCLDDKQPRPQKKQHSLLNPPFGRPSPINSGFPGGSDYKESACNAGDLGSIPWVGKIPWRREWLPTPVFLPGEFHGQRSLMGSNLQGSQSHTRLGDFHFHLLFQTVFPLGEILTTLTTEILINLDRALSSPQ